MQNRPLVVAYYLPQYHPIPENDQHWGKGFTEWTNTVNAKPLFEGHYQPHLPSELGFYDLRVPEVRQAQAALAREHGIDGFCYWHYWFGNGRRALERPFEEVLKSGKPDFPFCLAWANMSWTGVWHGAPDQIIIEQTYPGKADYEAHFQTLLDAFRDPRYITVDGKPLFLVQRPDLLPDAGEFASLWKRLAASAGLPGLFLVGIAKLKWNVRQHGFDAKSCFTPMFYIHVYCQKHNLPNFDPGRSPDRTTPWVLNYGEVLDSIDFRGFEGLDIIPTVVPNWDNTPRSGNRGVVLQDSTPALFARHFETAYKFIQSQPKNRQIVLIKSWNEWAEGNYLEPDLQWGRGYLEAMKSAIDRQALVNAAFTD